MNSVNYYNCIYLFVKNRFLNLSLKLLGKFICFASVMNCSWNGVGEIEEKITMDETYSRVP